MRREFTNKTKLAAWERCGGKCEKCKSKLFAGNSPEYDHIVPCALGGDNSLDNCQVLGRKCCHKPKSAIDIKMTRKSDRQRKAHLGIKPPSRFQTSRQGPFKRRLDGTVVRRDTGERV